MCNDKKRTAALALVQLLFPAATAAQVTALAEYAVWAVEVTGRIALNAKTGGYGAVHVTVKAGNLTDRHALDSYPDLPIA